MSSSKQINRPVPKPNPAPVRKPKPDPRKPIFRDYAAI